VTRQCGAPAAGQQRQEVVEAIGKGVDAERCRFVRNSIGPPFIACTDIGISP
jgi:hypothetical protein